MKTYWDYTDKERSEMTEEQVSALLDFELMSQGILKPKAPALEQFEPLKLATKTYYKIKYGSVYTFDVLFESVEDAHAVAKMVLRRSEHDWQTGRDFAMKKDDLSVEAVELPDESQKMEAAQALIVEKQKKDRNEDATRDFNAAMEKCRKACESVWTDWHASCRMAYDHKKVLDTFEEYKRLAGDAAVAAKFLAKAFSAEAISDAFEWFGIEKPAEKQEAA